VQTRDQKYKPMLGADDRPKVEFNADTMGRYREQIKKYYYDENRYDTYLDQLGVKFPTLAKP
jgi:aminobenzoyl-glutamate utilization protein B